MLNDLNVMLEVEEQVGHTNKPKKFMYLPIDSDIEDLKVADIPGLLGFENASVRVVYGPNHDAGVSSAFLCCWLAGEEKVSEFTLFSLMQAIQNNASMKRTISQGFIDNPNPDLLRRLENNESKAIETLSKVIEPEPLQEAIGRIRKDISSPGIYDILDEMGFLSKAEEKEITQGK